MKFADVLCVGQRSVLSRSSSVWQPGLARLTDRWCCTHHSSSTITAARGIYALLLVTGHKQREPCSPAASVVSVYMLFSGNGHW